MESNPPNPLIPNTYECRTTGLVYSLEPGSEEQNIIDIREMNIFADNFMKKYQKRLADA